MVPVLNGEPSRAKRVRGTSEVWGQLSAPTVPVDETVTGATVGVLADIREDVESLKSAVEDLRRCFGAHVPGASVCGSADACRLLLKAGRITPAQLLLGPHDPLAEAIVEALAAEGAMSISALSRKLMSETGKGDRKTVRGRLAGLFEEGVVSKDGASGTWQLNPAVLDRWRNLVSGLALGLRGVRPAPSKRRRKALRGRAPSRTP